MGVVVLMTKRAVAIPDVAVARSSSRNSRVGGVRRVIVLRRVPRRNSAVLARAVALCVQKLFRIDRHSRILMWLGFEDTKKKEPETIFTFGVSVQDSKFRVRELNGLIS